MPYSIPVFSAQPHNPGRVRSLIADVTAALADRRIDRGEAASLVREHVIGGLLTATRRKAGRLRKQRRGRRDSSLQGGGIDKVAEFVGNVSRVVDITKVTGWASSALADGEITEQEVRTLIEKVVVPMVLDAAGIGTSGTSTPKKSSKED